MILGVFVLLTIAVASLTRLIVADTIGLPFRRWVVNKWGDESWQAVLVHCPWCSGLWVAIPAGIAWALTTLPWRWWWLAVPAILAMRYMTGLLSKLEEL
jgi:hypothetical protein